ncbi:hypothetical protein [Streptomyces sp. NPDC048361]|uniref:hypothetical protein n=1 Tax=Streptomyces sp. NPDC048361 TaxID=3154720 RepID=UPI00341A31FF
MSTYSSHNVIAQQVPTARSALSAYVRARSVPPLNVMRRLYEIALDCEAEDPARLPSLEDVLEIWRAASVSRRGLGDDAVQAQLARLKAARRRQHGGVVLPAQQGGPAPRPTPPAADDAIRHLKAGRENDAFSLFWHIGQTHTPAEIRDVIAAYTIAQERDAVDAVLASASERRAEDVLLVTAALLEAQCYDDAMALVQASVQRSG